MIDVGAVIRFSTYLLPIPFMALFYLKTHRLDFLRTYGFLLLLLPLVIQLFVPIGYDLFLALAYLLFVLAGAYVFSFEGWGYPQALSISFCLAFFGSFLWELPIIVYTIFARGGIDGAFPLHMLFVFPMIFIYEKLKTNQPRKMVLYIVGFLMSYSVYNMLLMPLIDVNIWSIESAPYMSQVFGQTLWMINRAAVIVGLFFIYLHSTLRKPNITIKELKR